MVAENFNEGDELSKKIKALSQDVRINSAFNCVYEQFSQGQTSKAFAYFSNTVKSESDFAREEERVFLQKESAKKELDFFICPVASLNSLKAESE